jgi:hypothetical protein
LRSWAFGTSPHGLGLTTPQFWGYTPREIDALAEVHRRHINGWREPTKTVDPIQTMRDKLAVWTANKRMHAPMTPDEIEEVPEWARAPHPKETKERQLCPANPSEN